MAISHPLLTPLGAEFRLLLLLSRLELDDEQRKAALILCQEIGDWDVFWLRASERFILPLVYRHLRRLMPRELSSEQLQQVKHQVMAQFQHNMNVTASLSDMHRNLFEPLQIPYVCFKGPTLAARYYDEPAMRFCRDIDVLVSAQHMPKLLAEALAQGYQPLDPRPLASDQQSLEFASRCQKVVTLQSPSGVAVEFHKRIDNIGSVYDSDQLIACSVPLRIGSCDVPVMPTDELFVYICWHHTKHFWSRLHWLVDLDAMQRHPEFDRCAVLACADRHGLRSTVEACLAMFELMASPEFDSCQRHGPQVDELIEPSLQAMQGDLNKEKLMKKRMVTPDFAFMWQTNRRHWLRWKLFGWLRIFRPSYADYYEWPLQRCWQWLYRPLRPWRETRRRTAASKDALS